MENQFLMDFFPCRWTHVSHVRMAWNYIQELGMAEALPLVRCELDVKSLK